MFSHAARHSVNQFSLGENLPDIHNKLKQTELIIHTIALTHLSLSVVTSITIGRVERVYVV